MTSEQKSCLDAAATIINAADELLKGTKEKWQGVDTSRDHAAALDAVSELAYARGMADAFHSVAELLFKFATAASIPPDNNPIQ